MGGPGRWLGDEQRRIDLGLRASEWTLDLYGLRNTGIHGTYGLIWMANAAFGSIVRCDATKATNAAR
ncbi:hypothetical protein WL11_29145 [Burkholderia ubonensis]|nr:hypothetical protein WL11_29145 [Burkholderia ubonensis]